MKTSDFDYTLPSGYIAQIPVEPRDHSRLMVLDRNTGFMEHRQFYDIANFLREGDVLVFNDSRVIPARLFGTRADTGGRVEMLLLQRLGEKTWEVILGRGKRLKIGSKVEISGSSIDGMVEAVILEQKANGIRVMGFSDENLLEKLGNVPLPPYIHETINDPERYQTVYARVKGSAAAPTAGLHFTQHLLDKIAGRGITCLFITLHIGLDTFSPVREEDPLNHTIHKEYGVVTREVAGELSRARQENRRIVCVGTTSVRILEQVARLYDPLQLEPYADWVNLFILPGHKFKMVDAMVTNFHLPRSTLLMLVSAFAGKELINKAYDEAIAEGYHFYSFGDAMLIF